jgi:hypothetical protein
VPAAVAGLAFGFERAATRTDLLAGLSIRTILRATLLAVSTLSVSCFAAHEASVIVFDSSGALVEIPERSSVPLLVFGLAIGLECTTARADILAGLDIRTIRRVTLLAVSTLLAVCTLAVSTLPVPAQSAPEATVVVYDFAGTALIVRQLGGLPTAIAVLTISLQRRSIRSYVPAGLLVRASRSLLGSARPGNPEGRG